MEEKKQVQESTPEKNSKVTYDQLKALYEQSMIQTKKYYNEYQALRREMQAMREQMNYADINLAFKVLEFESHFDPQFVEKIVQRLEIVLTPVVREDTEEKNKEE